MGKKRALGLCRVIIYPSGRIYWSSVVDEPSVFVDEAMSHIPYALADITYAGRKLPYSYNAVDVLIAHLPKHLRLCKFCRHSIISNDETNRWCKLVKNGSLRKGTFDDSKAQRCAFFERETKPDPLDSRFYTIWINPRFGEKKG